MGELSPLVERTSLLLVRAGSAESGPVLGAERVRRRAATLRERTELDTDRLGECFESTVEGAHELAHLGEELGLLRLGLRRTLVVVEELFARQVDALAPGTKGVLQRLDEGHTVGLVPVRVLDVEVHLEVDAHVEHLPTEALRDTGHVLQTLDELVVACHTRLPEVQERVSGLLLGEDVARVQHRHHHLPHLARREHLGDAEVERTLKACMHSARGVRVLLRQIPHLEASGNLANGEGGRAASRGGRVLLRILATLLATLLANGGGGHGGGR